MSTIKEMTPEFESLDDQSITEKEMYCLMGYLHFKDTDPDALEKAYIYSRPYRQFKASSMLTSNAQKWASSESIKDFIDKNNSFDIPKDITPTEEIILRYERLYHEADNIDDKAKILKMIVDARHKNKEEMQKKEKIARVYLPLRCSECILYQREEEKLKLADAEKAKAEAERKQSENSSTL